MNLLIAIQNYTNALIKYGLYPKNKKLSLGKLEKLADLCMNGKIRKLSRYIPSDISQEKEAELRHLLDIIEETVRNDNSIL